MGTLGLVAVAVAAVGLSSCGGGGDKSAAKKPVTTAPPTTTTTVFVPTAPLTGLPDPTGASQTHSSLGVKIENTPEARPQSGLNVADIVYEEVVEGGITRFWAFFNTQAPTNVGPIRSVRFMDPNIVTPFGGVIAFSGGTPDNVALIRQTPTVQVDENNAGDAWVFSDNKLVKGRWVKQDAASPTLFLSTSLAPIKLTPGQTYVELAPTGAAVDLVASPPPPPTTLPPVTTTTKPKKK